MTAELYIFCKPFGQGWPGVSIISMVSIHIREFKILATNNGYRVRLKACFRIALATA